MIQRIGIFGGTFNPIHNGHIHLAETFSEVLKLDKLLLMPVWSPPHKRAENMPPADLRLQMCRAAVSKSDKIEVSGIEIERGGISYTCDTLQTLGKLYFPAEFFLIMGADMFLTIQTWKNFRSIMESASLCTCARHEGEYLKLCAHAQTLKEKYGARCYVGDFPVVDISSTEIRELIMRGKNVEGLVPDGVLKLIKANGLYNKS